VTAKPAPVRLPTHLEDPVVAVLAEIGLKAAAAQSALRGGRVAHAGVWVTEVLQAAVRLDRAWAAAVPPPEALA
jgi:hypothetical protein